MPAAMMHSGLIGPVVALVLWSLVMWLWLYATRIPAMRKAKIDPQHAVMTRELNLPPRAMWPADNYNHLMEQPTIFYAIAFAGHLIAAGDPANVMLAWGYVGLRVLHSLVQATVNVVTIRFTIFTFSSIVLTVLAVRVAMKTFAF